MLSSLFVIEFFLIYYVDVFLYKHLILINVCIV